MRVMESTEKENPLLKYLGETKQEGPRLDGESSDHHSLVVPT